MTRLQFIPTCTWGGQEFDTQSAGFLFLRCLVPAVNDKTAIYTYMYMRRPWVWHSRCLDISNWFEWGLKEPAGFKLNSPPSLQSTGMEEYESNFHMAGTRSYGTILYISYGTILYISQQYRLKLGQKMGSQYLISHNPAEDCRLWSQLAPKPGIPGWQDSNVILVSE